MSMLLFLLLLLHLVAPDPHRLDLGHRGQDPRRPWPCRHPIGQSQPDLEPVALRHPAARAHRQDQEVLLPLEEVPQVQTTRQVGSFYLPLLKEFTADSQVETINTLKDDISVFVSKEAVNVVLLVNLKSK